MKERRRGAGRPSLEKKDPGLLPMLESLVSPSTRGDPESPLRWTSKSLRALARELGKAKHPVGADIVGALLKSAGYSLQANSKTKEGVDHPDRDAQFEFINAKARDFLSRGSPVLSVDAKKKEFIAEHANRGREWELKGKPIKVLSHDYFVNDGAPHATPYGVYDISLIASTTTSKGLKVSAHLDVDAYPLRLRVTEHTKRSPALERDSFHGEWNYSLRPRTKRQQKAAAAEPQARVIITHAQKRERWLSLIGEQMKSGLNGKDFCAARGLNYWNYAGARRRLVGKIRKLRSPAS